MNIFLNVLLGIMCGIISYIASDLVQMYLVVGAIISFYGTMVDGKKKVDLFLLSIASTLIAVLEFTSTYESFSFQLIFVFSLCVAFFLNVSFYIVKHVYKKV